MSVCITRIMMGKCHFSEYYWTTYEIAIFFIFYVVSGCTQWKPQLRNTKVRKRRHEENREWKGMRGEREVKESGRCIGSWWEEEREKNDRESRWYTVWAGVSVQRCRARASDWLVLLSMLQDGWDGRVDLLHETGQAAGQCRHWGHASRHAAMAPWLFITFIWREKGLSVKPQRLRHGSRMNACS